MIAFCAGLALSSISGAAYLEHTQDDILTLSAMLNEAVVTEEVVYKGRQYTVINGLIDPEPDSVFTAQAVLETAFAKRTLRISPPSALPGVDLDLFSNGIEKLAAAELAFLDTKEPFIDRMLASQTFFPLRALSDTWAAEVARRNFLKSGDARDLEAYIETSLNIAPHYLRELYMLELAFRYFAPDEVEYVTERHSITKSNSLATIRTIRESVREQNQRLNIFIACIKGEVRQCDPGSIHYPIVDVFDFQRPGTDKGKYAMFRAYHEWVDTSVTGYPDILLSDGYCQNPDLPPLIGYTKNRGMPAIREAGDARLLATADYLELPFFKYFYDLGFSHIPSTPFSHYTCMVVPYDQGAAFATWAVRDYALAHQLSVAVTDESLRNTLSQFEQAAAESMLLDEREARGYVRAALAARLSGDLPPSLEPDLLDLVLMIRYKTVGMEYFLAHTALSEANNIKGIQDSLPTRVSVARSFFTRTAFAAFAMILVPEFDPREIYESFSLPRDETPFLYVSTMADDIPVTELTETLRRYYELH